MKSRQISNIHTHGFLLKCKNQNRIKNDKNIELDREQKGFNIALVLQDESLTIFTCPANTCTSPLKAYAIKNIREL